MTDPEKTLPPWRDKGLKAWEWARAHPALVIPTGTFLLGVLTGWWLTG